MQKDSIISHPLYVNKYTFMSIKLKSFVIQLFSVCKKTPSFLANTKYKRRQNN